MKIDYSNMPNGASKLNFTLRYIFNQLRTWYTFHIKYPWVKYEGFVRVMKGTDFAQNMDVKIGHNVQFGNYCNIASNVHFGNNILMAGRVCFEANKTTPFPPREKRFGAENVAITAQLLLKMMYGLAQLLSL